MRVDKKTQSRQDAIVVPDQASRQRQILDQLIKDYLHQVRDILQPRDLVKGSVYLVKVALRQCVLPLRKTGWAFAFGHGALNALSRMLAAALAAIY